MREGDALLQRGAPESLAIAEEKYAEVYSELENLVNGEFDALQEALERAQVPWTPGRGLPLLN